MEYLRKLIAKISGNPIARNLVLAFCAIIVFGFVANLLLNLFTRHGQIREVPDLLKAPVDNVIKFTVYHPSACEEMCAPLFTPTWQTKAKIASSGKEWMDCNPLGVNKGTAIRFLQEYLGIAPDETCTFGDNLNDIEMLESAGTSYAVSNAREEVIAAAKRTCAPYWENGVLQVLKTFL